MKNAGKACNNRLYRHIRTFEKIVKNYFVIYVKNDGFLARKNQYGYIDIKTHIAYANCDISDLSNRFALDKLKDGL